MQISPYNFQTIQKQPTKPIGFKASPAQFSHELKQVIKTAGKEHDAKNNLIDTFKKIFSQITQKENAVGSGNFGSVYKIDDEFVLKTINANEPQIDGISLNEHPLTEKFKTYYGDFVAQIGNTKILKNAVTKEDSICAGVKEGLCDQAQKINYYRETYLNRFSKLPQKAFDDVAEDFKTAASLQKSFDTINPNNFIADGEKIKIVDDLQTPNDKFFNTLAGLAKVFITSLDRNTKAEYDIFSVGSRRNILRKIILAGEKNELKFGASTPEREELSHALSLCDIQTPWREIQSDLCEIRRRNPNMSERLEKVNKYIDEMEAPQYNPFMD